jgi:hypothetical protein
LIFLGFFKKPVFFDQSFVQFAGQFVLGLASVLWTQTVNLREYWAWPRRKTQGSGRAAAKLAGVPRVVLLAKLGELGAAALRQTEAELAEDLAHA